MHHPRGFTFRDMLILTACVAAVIAVGLVAIPPLRSPGVGPPSHQLRAIVQGCILFAQGNGEYYPGLDPDGNVIGATAAGRFKLLQDGNYFTPEYAISPSESDPTIQVWPGSGPITANHHSYATLQISVPGARRTEWTATTNKFAPVISDRNTGTDASAHVSSIHVTGTGKWHGNIAYNDCHVEFAKRHVVRRRKYGSVVNKGDNLFDAAGADDAYMIHSGQ